MKKLHVLIFFINHVSNLFFSPIFCSEISLSLVAECFVCNTHLMFDSFEEPNINEQATTMDTNFDDTDIFIQNLGLHFCMNS